MRSAARQPLVMLPGLLCTDVLWRHQIDHLDDIADIAVADLTRDDSVAAMAERVLAEAPSEFVLAGLSMGGYVALEIMRRAPDRVTKLALLDTSARTDDETQRRRREGLLAQVRKGDPEKFQGVTRRLLPLLIHPERQSDPDLVEPIKGMARSVGLEAYIRQQTAILGRPDGRADLARIACPSLVVCGEQDILTPPDLSREIVAGINGGIKGGIAKARLVMIEDCGHLSTLERPGAVNAALRAWLTDGND